MPKRKSDLRLLYAVGQGSFWLDTVTQELVGRLVTDCLIFTREEAQDVAKKRGGIPWTVVSNQGLLQPYLPLASMSEAR